MKQSRVFWITGLSGSGKTTLCRLLVERLREDGQPVVMLDGDDLRAAMAATEAHSREERLQLAMRYSRLCRMIASQGVDVAISTISMFKEVHAWNRANLPGYFEIYLKVPLEELRRRDAKGIYSKFDAGELHNVAGLDLPVDEPNEPNLLLKYTPSQTIKSMADELITQIQKAMS